VLPLANPILRYVKNSNNCDRIQCIINPINDNIGKTHSRVPSTCPARAIEGNSPSFSMLERMRSTTASALAGGTVGGDEIVNVFKVFDGTWIEDDLHSLRV
jgi:hypothetical protein